MSKRNSDGDVIANQLSLVEAKGQKFLASLFGSHPEAISTSSATKLQDEDEDLKEDFGHDRLGVGSIVPKDIEDGSFTRRIPTSNDKLLEQLIGKKKAKAHLAAKQEAARPKAKTQRHGRATAVKQEESEDEEEGRAAAFKSKRRRANGSKPVQKRMEDESENEDEEARAKRLGAGGSNGDSNKEAAVMVEVKNEQSHADQEVRAAKASKRVPSRGKAKPTSFLDEILAERSKKKEKKHKNKVQAEA